MTPNRSRPLSGLCALAAVSLALTACSSSAGTSASGSTSTTGTSSLAKTLAFSPLSLQPPALAGLAAGIKGYAGSKGWQVVVQDPNFDPAKQVQSLSEVISSGRAGAAWVLAVAPPTMGPVIRTAQSKGVPILVNGTPTEYGFHGPQPGITFDYVDYRAAGTALGDQAATCATSKLGGAGQALSITSTVGQAGKQEFDAATNAALSAGAPGSKLVQTLLESDRAKAQTDIGAALQGHPDINLVMASTDEGVLGAIGAFAAAGKKLPCVIGFGGNAEVLKDVRAGTVFAAVALQFQADVAQAFDTLVKMQTDPKANGLVLTVPQKILTASS